MKYLYLLLFLTPGVVFADDIDLIRKIYYSTNQAIKDSQYQKKSYCIQDKNVKSIEGSRWVEILSENDEKLCLKGMPLAQVFLKKLNVKKVRMTLNTPSGDWSLEKEFYFYDDGDVAFIFYRLATMLGYDFDKDKVLSDIPYIIERREYFDSSGKKIKTINKAFSQKTGKSVSEKYLKKIDVENYYHVSDLPFPVKKRGQHP